MRSRISSCFRVFSNPSGIGEIREGSTLTMSLRRTSVKSPGADMSSMIIITSSFKFATRPVTVSPFFLVMTMGAY